MPRYSRRDVVRTLSSMAALALAGCGANQAVSGSSSSSSSATAATGTSACVAETNVTRGPFFVDAVNDTNDTASSGNYRLDSLIPLRSDIRTDTTGTAGTMAGAQVVLTITVNNATCTGVLSGYRVDIWHANAAGVYSDVLDSTNDNGLDHRGQNFLRGFQYTDANGQVTFTTNYPGIYSGRCPHIHVKVRSIAATTVAGASVTPATEATTQIFFTEATTTAVLAASITYSSKNYDTPNSKDSIYLSENPTIIPALTGSATAGYAAAVSIGITVGKVSA